MNDIRVGFEVAVELCQALLLEDRMHSHQCFALHLELAMTKLFLQNGSNNLLADSIANTIISVDVNTKAGAIIAEHASHCDPNAKCQMLLPVQTRPNV